MSHQFENEIICPYCNYKYNDSWEVRACEEKCSSCDKLFQIETHHITEYSTHRMSCEKGNHVWKKPHGITNDEERIERWRLERSCLYKPELKPYCLWIRDCENCDESEYSKHLEVGTSCPWPISNQKKGRPQAGLLK